MEREAIEIPIRGTDIVRVMELLEWISIILDS